MSSALKRRIYKIINDIQSKCRAYYKSAYAKNVCIVVHSC